MDGSRFSLAGHRVAVVVLLAGLSALAVHAWSYLPFIADDALISLRYADRLLDGHGLTWNDGERVEGYSNLLWILLVALIGWFGVDLIDAVRVLGLVSGAATIAAFAYAFRPREGSAAPAALAAGLAGALAVALSGPVAVWTVGGLEQPLVCALLAWAIVLGLRRVDGAEPGGFAGWLGAAVPLALLCWTRPDGALFTAAACAGLVLARGANGATWRSGLRLASLPALAYLAQLAFRLAYYGEWFPNSAHAKLALTSTRIVQGFEYVGSGLLWLGALAVPALIGAVPALRGPAAARIRFLAAPLAMWTAYVIFIGGDIFPARRHLAPLVVLLALLLAEGVRSAASRAPRATWLGVAVGLLLLLGTQQLDPANARAREETWEWDGEVVGRLLRRAFLDRDPLVAVDPGGTLPYFSGLPSLDMLGINDHYLAHHRPETFGRGWLGHELGDGSYVLDREPDLVLFCGPRGRDRPCFRSGKQMVTDPRFAARYRLAGMRGTEPYPVDFVIWVRAEGGKLGVIREPGRVWLPGYLMFANPRVAAELTPDGRLAPPVRAGQPVGYAALELPEGRWRLTAEPPAPALEVQVRGAATRSAPAGLTVELPPGGGRVDLLVTNLGGETIWLDGLTLERLEDFE